MSKRCEHCRCKEESGYHERGCPERARKMTSPEPDLRSDEELKRDLDAAREAEEARVETTRRRYEEGMEAVRAIRADGGVPDTRGYPRDPDELRQELC